MNGRSPHKSLRSRAAVLSARAALVVVAALACGGCGLTAKWDKWDKDTTASIPVDYRQRHPIAIREGDQSMEVFVGARRGALAPTQRAEIVGFAKQWRREATGGIAIDVPVGTPNARAAAAAAAEVQSILAQSGVPHSAMAARRYRPEDPALLATVRLNYPKMMAQAGPCGLWPQDLGLPHDASPTLNRPYWNLGCTTQRNLASMVAEPADLVQPRTETPIYAARRSVVFDKYRKGESPSTVYPDADKGKISDVAR